MMLTRSGSLFLAFVPDSRKPSNLFPFPGPGNLSMAMIQPPSPAIVKAGALFESVFCVAGTGLSFTFFQVLYFAISVRMTSDSALELEAELNANKPSTLAKVTAITVHLIRTLFRISKEKF